MPEISRNKEITRGDIFYIKAQKFYGSEQSAGRPAVIVSNNKNNEYSPTVEIAYLTCSCTKPNLPTHVTIHSAKYTSIVLCEQIHTISKTLLENCVGRCTDDELNRIDIGLAVSLSLKQMLPPDIACRL